MNFFEYDASSEYPKDYYYRPSEEYPEYPFKNFGISSEKNKVYQMIRNMFYELGLDKEHYNTPDWNPLVDYIVPGNTVLIKPNLVFHHNGINSVGHNDMECLVTHPSIIRCVLDYTIIALRGTGTIIIGDAPVQECIFERLLDIGGYRRIERFYSQMEKLSYDIRFQDFRQSVMKTNGKLYSQEINKNNKFTFKVINLGKDSLFSNRNSKKLRVTNFDAEQTVKGHTGNRQEYCISDACLQADVIVNLPKPKTHRLAGMTGALKNMIGINAMKEYIPHYTLGARDEGGDAYPYKDKIRTVQYKLWDIRNYYYGRHKSVKAMKFTEKVNRLEKYKKKSNQGIEFGAWKGNDTIWRSVLDINYIVKYADKAGSMSESEQRKIITIGDMIVCGENNGPLAPEYKKVGGILFADDSVEFDLFLSELMGFNYKRIPVLRNALTEDKRNLLFRSNDSRFSGKKIEKSNSFSFLPQVNWRGYIEKKY